MFRFFDASNERIESRYRRIGFLPEGSDSLLSMKLFSSVFAIKYTSWNFGMILSSFSFRVADGKELIRVEFWPGTE